MELPEDLEHFFNKHTPISYDAGETILRMEDEPQGVMYLKKGFVRMYVISISGEELTLNIYKKGSFFPVTWAIAGVPNTYFYEAMSDVEILRAPKDDVVDFLKKNPDELYQLSRRIIIGLSAMAKISEYLTFGTAGNKIALILSNLTERFGTSIKNGSYEIKLPLTHQIIGSMAGLTRETTSVEMQRLKKMGLLSYKRRGPLMVNDKKKLEKLIQIDQAELEELELEEESE